MACALTAGYLTDCKDNLGGAQEMKVIEIDNVQSFTVTSNVITSVDNATGKRWWRYRPARETLYGKFTVEANVQNSSVSYAQEVGLVVNKLQTSVMLELQRLAQNTLYIAIKDGNGRNWVYGYVNGMDTGGGEGGTGTARGDRNGASFTFAGGEPAMPIEMDEATYDSLETPGS